MSLKDELSFKLACSQAEAPHVHTHMSVCDSLPPSCMDPTLSMDTHTHTHKSTQRQTAGLRESSETWYTVRERDQRVSITRGGRYIIKHHARCWAARYRCRSARGDGSRKGLHARISALLVQRAVVGRVASCTLDAGHHARVARVCMQINILPNGD